MKSLHLSFHLKIITGILAFFLMAGSALALDMEVSGEIKTGLYIEQSEQKGQTISYTRLYNNDGDSGLAEGRLRVGINATQGNFGIRFRFSQEEFKRRTSATAQSGDKGVKIDHVYAYGNLLNNQLAISAGLLGESPWATGGPELFYELEYTNGMEPVTGIRFEFKPTFLSFLNGLNIGFVLNREDSNVPPDAKQMFGDLLMETILGIAWEHEYFAFRFAYRFDRGMDSPAAIVQGERLLYRIEERILGKFLPGMQIWANGYYTGLNAEMDGSRGAQSWGRNWLYISYDSEYFTTGLNIGYREDFIDNAQQLEIKPSFYWKFFDNFLTAGLMAGMEMGFNNVKDTDDFYNFWFLEPQVKVNFTSNLYASAVYRFISFPLDKLTGYQDTTHWINIRFVYTF